MAAVQAGRTSVSRPSLARAPVRSSTVKCCAQKNAFANMSQKLATAGTAALLSLSTLSGMPAIASEFDIVAEPAPTNMYYIDDASVLSKSTRSDVNRKLKNLEITTGYHVEVVTVRKLEVETDSYAFADQVLANWYPTPEAVDKKGILLVVTATKEGALAGGQSFQEALGEELADSITGENVAIFTEQERYNECVESSVDRLVAKLNGDAVPEAPKRQEVERKRTYKTKEETDNSRTITTTIVGTLLLIACVVPMLQYYGYTARD